MKTIEQLKLGYSDAQNYSKRKDKVFFNEIFVRNSFLDKLLNENVYFLIGENERVKLHMQLSYPTIITRTQEVFYRILMLQIMKNFIH